MSRVVEGGEKWWVDTPKIASGSACEIGSGNLEEPAGSTSRKLRRYPLLSRGVPTQRYRITTVLFSILYHFLGILPHGSP